MRLADFIRDHHDAILEEWESFARTLAPPESKMSRAALRDHADAILGAIVADMEARESDAERSAKAKGHKHQGKLGKLGQVHASLRLESGFTLRQVLAEYRALRASVLRLWQRDGTDPEGVGRFNESIDEALTEAADRFDAKTTQTRDALLGVVGHDLRNPLGAVLVGAAMLSESDALDDRHARIATRILNSGKRMERIVGDLLDLTRTRLGGGIPIVRQAADLGPICETVIGELRAVHVDAAIRFVSHGDVRGRWDGERLAQLLSNLVANALQHGEEGRKSSHLPAHASSSRASNRFRFGAPRSSRCADEPQSSTVTKRRPVSTRARSRSQLARTRRSRSRRRAAC